MRGGAARATSFIRPAMFVGLLSLAGVPPLVGFVSKEHVLAAAEAGAADGQARAWSCSLAGLLTVALTAAYCMRAWLVLDDLAAADIERHEADTAGRPASARRSTVLAVLTVVGGLVVVTAAGRPRRPHRLARRAAQHPAHRRRRSRRALGAPRVTDPAVQVVGAADAVVRRRVRGRRALRRARRAPGARARPPRGRSSTARSSTPTSRGAAVATRVGGAAAQRAHRGERAASGLAWVVAGVVAVARGARG